MDKTTSETKRDTDKNQNVVQDTKETKLPDGTIVIETHKTVQTITQTETQNNSETSKDISKTVKDRPSYRVGAIYEPPIKDFQDMSYAVTVEKRLFSEVYMGIEASSRHTVGLTISLGF